MPPLRDHIEIYISVRFKLDFMLWVRCSTESDGIECVRIEAVLELGLPNLLQVFKLSEKVQMIIT